jgi:gamma-glutamyl phosphate reductase
MTASADNVQLTEKEINERVHILHKLREHLTEQRNRFYRYLDVLEHEEQDILSNNVDKLEYHVELEKDLAREIISFQKVIDPLNSMYKLTVPDQDVEIPKLQESLEHIQEEVEERSKRNQLLLKERMESVRNEITSIKKNTKSRSVYDDYRNQPSMIDIIT